MTRSLAWNTLLIGLAALAAGPLEARSQPPDEGWTTTHLDLEIWIERDPPSLHVEGVMSLRLESATSPGPTLALNRGPGGMVWDALDASEDGIVELNTHSDSAPGSRLAEVRLTTPAQRGHELQLYFGLEHESDLNQLKARKDIALASWVEGWYPVVLPPDGSVGSLTAESLAAPGTTTLDVPGEWLSLSDGELSSRERLDGRSVDRWDVTGRPVARSFVAGPYRVSDQESSGRTTRIYLCEDNPRSPEQLAELVSGAMTALEARLGPFPFPSYGIAEVPDGVGWGGASQQTFMMATRSCFEPEHGNLPLWAHEMSHGWWGNTVYTRGPGHKMVGEALAQLGVLIAVEALEGREAMVEFLERSRSGYNLLQCARGYFKLAMRGKDHPLATLGESELDSNATHNLADSKGMWVLHMLRGRVGDEVFFATLRGLLRDHSGGWLSLDDFRSAYRRAAPEAGLEAFFAQWLDRRGAPWFKVDWTTVDEGRVEIVLTQPEKVEPFALDLDLELSFAEGEAQRLTAEVRERETRLTCDVPGPVTAVELDPDRDLLIWRPDYKWWDR